jgi:hypothetical protein
MPTGGMRVTSGAAASVVDLIEQDVPRSPRAPNCATYFAFLFLLAPLSGAGDGAKFAVSVS